MRTALSVFGALLGIALLVGQPSTAHAKSAKSRGIGVYPGNPAEYFGPELAPGNPEYRNVALMRAVEHSSASDVKNVAQLITDGIISTPSDKEFVSSWRSGGYKSEWVCVDLGAVAKVDKVKLHWINAPVAGRIEMSLDGTKWDNIAPIAANSEISFPKTRCRYVRLSLDSSANNTPFELSELEVFGTGGIKVIPAKAAEREGNRQYLAGGEWKLCRFPAAKASGEEISRSSFNATNWIVATVPGTVLASYVNVGAVHHPNYKNNEAYISDSYFCEDFWYRNTFNAHVDSPRQFLHFSGVNLKADVYLNGKFVGSIVGAFREKDLDVTGILVEGRNDLAVKIYHNENYGEVKTYGATFGRRNGGIVGADNPTMHATIGWDWLPTVRGRNMGIYDDVYVKYIGEVGIEDPFVRTELNLPDTTSARILAQATLVNHSDKTITGVLKGFYGEVKFEKSATLAPHEKRVVELEPLTLNNPKLWWPKGYGEPNLYDVNFTFEHNGTPSDSHSFKSGVRQMEYKLYDYKPVSRCKFGGKRSRNDNLRLDIYVNGRRLNGFGGNWGFPEHLLNYRSREYDIAVAYHADQNFNMIRNWVGMTGARAFYEACDRHGLMIWQDFWLANPGDGPNPADPDRFNETATEYVRRIRNHPSICIYVGRNEGYPPAEIDNYLMKMVPQEHPGLFYISHSGAEGVSGGGPYRTSLVSRYFDNLFGADKLHSERGAPTIMNYENLARSLGEENVNPVNTIEHPNDMYGAHDFNLGTTKFSAQRGYLFNEFYAKAFGSQPHDAKEFTMLSQWICYDTYRAIFESRAEHRQGVLLWMSHPSWPSLVWQTYDYFFEPTAAYFGCKKGSEPIHIFLNPVKRDIEVVNYSAGNLSALKATAHIYDITGKEVWSKTVALDIKEDATKQCFPLDVPATTSDTYFVRLYLHSADGKQLSENFYWQGKEEGNFQGIRKLPQTKVDMKVSGKNGQYTAIITNNSNTPALMLRVKAVDSKTNDLILPVWYSDNYISLMAGESRTITIKVRNEDCKGKPIIKLEGFNCK